MTEGDAETWDVMIIGGGLGGTMAALRFAETSPDADIKLLVHHGERFHDHPGTLGILGYVPPDARPPASNGSGDVPAVARSRRQPPLTYPLETVAELPDDHPYRSLGVRAIREGLAAFDEHVGGYRGSFSAKNALVLTPTGRLRPVLRYPSGMAPGLGSGYEPMLLIGFEELLDLDVTFLADALREQVPFAVETKTVELPIPVSASNAHESLAAAFDDNRETDNGTPIREWLRDRVADDLDIEPRVGLPAVLGLDQHEEVRRWLEDELHVSIFELPTGSPCIPGQRLERDLRTALRNAGVSVSRTPVTEVVAAEDRIEAVATDEGTYDAAEFVLATGGVETGGLVANRSGVREPLFSCPVSYPDDRSDWTAGSPLGDQPFTRFCLDVDESHRPLDSSGTPQYQNLRAAGVIRSGANHVLEESGEGIAIASGYAVGEALHTTL